MARVIRLCVCASLLVGIAAPSAAFAQDSAPPPETRAELLQRSRDEKEKSLAAYQMNGLERALNTVETRVLSTFGRDGVHPKFGSLATGSGFAFGVGYLNRRLVDREGALNIWGAVSLKKVLGGRGQLRLAESRRRVADTRHLRATPELPAAGFLWYRTRFEPRRAYGFQDRELHGGWARGSEARPIADGWRRRRIFPARAGAGQKQGTPLNRSAVH